jgi:hypothetical protein
MLSQSSGQALLATCCALVSCFAYASTMKMEVLHGVIGQKIELFTLYEDLHAFLFAI